MPNIRRMVFLPSLFQDNHVDKSGGDARKDGQHLGAFQLFTLARAAVEPLQSAQPPLLPGTTFQETQPEIAVSAAPLPPLPYQSRNRHRSACRSFVATVLEGDECGRQRG